MRILFVHERFGALGGAEANLLATASALRDRGHDLALAHGTPTGNGEADWEDTFPVRFPLPAENAGRALEDSLNEFRPEVVYLHKLADASALAILARDEPPVVRMVHDHDLYCMRGYKYAFFSRRICVRPASLYCLFPCGACVGRNRQGSFPFRWVSYLSKRREIQMNRRFRRLVVATSYMRDELLRNGFEAGRIEIHAPVPPPVPAHERPSFGPRNLAVYAGQIVRGKGVDVLLQALSRVATPFECAIIGDGPQRAECEALARRLGLAHRVRFVGFLPQREIASWYREATLSVMSSLWPEPFGATGLEAMRCGLPVVAFDAGGIREWLLDGENGFLVPWMDRGIYAASVERLLRDKTLARRLGENGRQLAEDRFNFESYIAGLEDLLARTALTTHAQ